MKPDSGSSLSDSRNDAFVKDTRKYERRTGKKGKGGDGDAALPLPSFLPFSCSRFLNFGDSTISEP